MKQPENLSRSRLFLKTQKQSPMLRILYELEVGAAPPTSL